MAEIFDTPKEVLTFSEMQEQGSSFFTKLWDSFVAYIPTLIVALILLIIGMILNKVIIKLIGKGFQKSRLDATIYKFLTSLIKATIYIILFMIVLTILGIPTTSILAVIGSAGLAIGLSMKDSLSNVVGGILVLFEKQFKVGDYCEIDGVGGTIDEISLLSTRLLTPDNKMIYLPNGIVSNSTVINYSRMLTRRIEWIFSISYNNDFKKAIEVIKETAVDNEKIHKTPEPFVHVNSLGSSSVDIVVRVWVDSADYWDVYFEMLELIKEAFDNTGIVIPFNQLDVHVLNDFKNV